MRVLPVGLALCLLVSAAQAFPRSRVVVREFQRANPCPASGARRGACPGWQMDHVQALCAGGRDEVANLQWLSVRDHALKTQRDVAACRHRVYRGPI